MRKSMLFSGVVAKKNNLAVLGFFMMAVLGILIWRGWLVPLAALAAIISVSWLAWRFPVAAVVTLLGTGMAPTILQMTTLLPTDLGSSNTGARAQDIVLVGMAGAILWEAIRRGGSYRRNVAVLIPAAGFATWLILEIARNINQYGLSAPGEFRFRYLVLALPAFIGARAFSSETRMRIRCWLILFSIPLPFLMIPVIGLNKGWTIGPESRFFPSGISLALAYGLIFILLAVRHKVTKIPGPIAFITVLVGLFMILIDSHRSVWVVCMLSIIVLIILKEVHISKMWSWGLGVGIIIGIVLFASFAVGLDPITYVFSRANALIHPMNDPTSAWRVDVWRAQMKVFMRHPATGLGFGGYWDAYVPELGTTITTSPHSLWVQTLVKLGAIGLAFYLWLAAAILALLWGTWKKERAVLQPADSLLLEMGVIAAVGSIGYHTVYVFEFAGLVWIGLALAVAFHGNGIKQDV